MQTMQKQNNQQKFIEKHKQELSKQFLKLENSLDSVNINIINDNDIQQAAQQIQKNHLVAFPTQTVYGLGANALNEQALLQIYKVKRRPLSDPIIVHVLDLGHAKKLVQATQQQLSLVKILTDQFWPGPLTVILKANLNILPAVVTAQTGFVGIRSPKHPIARQLLKLSQRPIGAPSANLFAHVSPTSAAHVFNDFYQENISLIDSNQCEFGIQSTVVKIIKNPVTEKLSLHVLREGSLSFMKLKSYVQNVYSNLKQQAPLVQINKRVKKVQQNENMQAPGQLLKHYSPYLPCYYCDDLQKMKQYQNPKIALMSFSTQYEVVKESCKYYFDATNYETQESEIEIDEKFCTKEEIKGMKNLYFLLRKCQNLDVEEIIICWKGDKSGTVWDKIFRATEGKHL